MAMVISKPSSGTSFYFLFIFYLFLFFCQMKPIRLETINRTKGRRWFRLKNKNDRKRSCSFHARSFLPGFVHDPMDFGGGDLKLFQHRTLFE